MLTFARMSILGYFISSTQAPIEALVEYRTEEVKFLILKKEKCRILLKEKQKETGKQDGISDKDCFKIAKPIEKEFWTPRTLKRSRRT